MAQFPPAVPVRFVTILAALLAVALPSWAAAQDRSASVTGRILDPTGSVVVGASVALEAGAGLVAATLTGPTGAFEILNLLPGSYLVHVSYPGLLTAPIPLRLEAGEHHALELPLRLSARSEEVLVSAGLVEVPLSSSPSLVTVFTEQDIGARQLESAADLLRLTPGVGVVQSGGRGALASLFPRGGESDYSLILVDGVRLNSLGGGFDLALLPVADIGRIEIVRGPQSALFGADAIGGVVQIITRNGGPARISGLIEGGTFGSIRSTAAAAGSVGTWSWGTSIERAASDGFTGVAPGTGERVSNDDGDHTSAALHLRFATAAATVAAHGRLLETERGFPGPFGEDPNGTYGGIDRISRGWNEHRTLGLQAGFTFSPRLRARASVSYADLDGRFRSPFDTSFNRTQRGDGRWQLDGALSEIVGFTAGVEILGERADSTYIIGRTGNPVPIRRKVAGTFLEGRLAWRSGLTANLGLRIERIRRDAVEASDVSFPPRPTLSADTVTSANPRLAVSWLVHQASAGPWSWTRLRANAATGIRPPDAFEIAFTDNPLLVPERSRSFDVGIEQALFDARAVVEATWFHNRYDDLIVAVGGAFQDASRFRTDNIANARAQGLELSVSSRPHAALQIRAGYTYLDSSVLAVDGRSGRAPSPFEPGDALVRRPRHQGWIDLVATHGWGSAFARLGARGGVLEVDPSFGAFGGKVEAPGFATTDLGGSVILSRWLTVFGRATNVLDAVYEEAFGFPSPGRAFIGGVRIAASR